jgi:hypothetical protein
MCGKPISSDPSERVVSAMTSVFGTLWARLVGASGGAETSEPPLEAVDYNGYRIRPAPYRVEGGFQTAGVIEKDFPEGTKEHRFVRAEAHPSRDDAATFAIAKGKQIIDQAADRLFER